MTSKLSATEGKHSELVKMKQKAARVRVTGMRAMASVLAGRQREQKRKAWLRWMQLCAARTRDLASARVADLDEANKSLCETLSKQRLAHAQDKARYELVVVVVVAVVLNGSERSLHTPHSLTSSLPRLRRPNVPPIHPCIPTSHTTDTRRSLCE